MGEMPVSIISQIITLLWREKPCGLGNWAQLSATAREHEQLVIIRTRQLHAWSL